MGPFFGPPGRPFWETLGASNLDLSGGHFETFLNMLKVHFGHPCGFLGGRFGAVLDVLGGNLGLIRATGLPR